MNKNRVQCIAPSCRRTCPADRLRPGENEWLCAVHWRMVSRDKKRLYARAKRRRYSAARLQRIWERCRADAIKETLQGLGF